MFSGRKYQRKGPSLKALGSHGCISECPRRANVFLVTAAEAADIRQFATRAS